MPTPIAQDLWTTVQRPRAWSAYITRPGDTVTVRHHAVLTGPDEDLTEYPETWMLSWTEWEETHETTYGLTIAGKPTAAHAADNAAWRKLRRIANGTTPYTEENVREAFGAIRRILTTLATEIEDD